MVKKKQFESNSITSFTSMNKVYGASSKLAQGCWSEEKRKVFLCLAERKERCYIDWKVGNDFDTVLAKDFEFLNGPSSKNLGKKQKKEISFTKRFDTFCKLKNVYLKTSSWQFWSSWKIQFQTQAPVVIQNIF